MKNIDARLADAHELVEKLKGPFDFVFSDADKNWYKNYFIALAPKLEVDGCFTAHNARSTRTEGIREFIDYVTDFPSKQLRRKIHEKDNFDNGIIFRNLKSNRTI